MPDSRLPRALASAIADGKAIDWASIEAEAQDTDPDLVHRFHVISAIGAARAGRHVRHRTVSTVVLIGQIALLSLAAAKLSVAAIGAGAALDRAAPASNVPLVAANVLLFGAAGALLVIGSARDRRLRSLGTLFLLIAAALADALLPRGGSLGAMAATMRRLPADAFLATALWLFVSVFPSDGVGRARRLADGFLVAATAAGAVLLLANAAHGWQLWEPASGIVGTTLRLLDREAPALLYWPLLFGLAAPALPYLVWKSRIETIEQRHRVAFFVTMLAIGLSPMLLAVILTPVVPLLRDPAWRMPVGVFLYAALASVVPSTVYAVSVERVMSLHLVIRATMRYALARSAVWCASLGPLLYFAIDTYRHRESTLVDYFFRAPTFAPLLLSVAGFLVLTFRQQILQTVDRRFLREQADHAEGLARLERRLREARAIREIAAALEGELRRALHPSVAAIFVYNHERSALVPLSGVAPVLPGDSAVLDLVRSSRTEILLDAESADSIVPLLPQRDRQWLEATGLSVFVPLTSSPGILLGVVALGQGLNGLPYTRRDYMLVTAMSGQAALRMENRLLRDEGGEGGVPAAGLRSLNWQHEPAALCRACALLWAPDQRVCSSCGEATVAAALPLVINGKFRVERLLGSGGTGVVYLAVDVALDRRVAIKTLPAIGLEHVGRLHREARAMAAVRHPNLALIYGTEHWQGTPLLIVEYLEAGTLLDRLGAGAPPVAEVVDLGIVLADVLDRIHASGVLHRDIKPSNIGYTADGLPKLLDFGLAVILDRSKGAFANPVVLRRDRQAVSDSLAELHPGASLTITQQLVGTPLYLSPEAVAGAPPQPSFDLWSLSLVLYEALAGRHPLAGKRIAEVLESIELRAVPDVRDLRPDCPSELAAFLNDALSLVEVRRPRTAAELRTGLRRLRARVDA